MLKRNILENLHGGIDVERMIWISQLEKGFSVDLKQIDREAKTKYYPSATDCCSAKVNRKDFCSRCGELSNGKTHRKIVDVSKIRLPDGSIPMVDVSLLDEIKKQLDDVSEVRVSQFTKELPADASERYERMMKAGIVDKKLNDYKEMQELLRGRYGVGMGNFGGCQRKVILYLDAQGVICMRKLTSDDQQVAFDSEEVLTRLASVKIDQELLDIEKQIVDQATKPLTDVSYKDMRVAMEEELIEKVLSGEQPTPIAPKLQEQKVENEKDRLKRLLAAKN